MGAPAHIEAPVRAPSQAMAAASVVADRLQGRPIEVWFRWHDIHGDDVVEQAPSDDAGAHWK
jgi:hypothetical protein